ncbi:hypothetical protein [Bradyrhizobium sp. SZCCHNS1012]|uniref:hypothetical protein n=1 Tax=Bradyrhizobium sp. SZCCHNS1012 TaxID=3057297 RepID=UPI00291700E6|nr:hypothetical protein [Bradyrhizobium sp. SZCCHNS1012]
MKIAVILGLFALVCFIGYVIARAALPGGVVAGDPSAPVDPVASDDTTEIAAATAASVPSVPVPPAPVAETPAAS